MARLQARTEKPFANLAIVSSHNTKRRLAWARQLIWKKVG